MNYNNSEFLASYGLSRQLPDSDRPRSFSPAAPTSASRASSTSSATAKSWPASVPRRAKRPPSTFTTSIRPTSLTCPATAMPRFPNAERERWDDLINSHFEVDRAVCLLVQLLDSRHAPSADDADASSTATTAFPLGR